MYPYCVDCPYFVHPGQGIMFKRVYQVTAVYVYFGPEGCHNGAHLSTIATVVVSG